MRNDLRISFRNKLVIESTKSVFQLDIVFYDSVVYDDYATSTVAMRMCVLFSGTTVCGPASVTDSIGAIERRQTNRLFEIPQLPLSATNLELVLFVDDSDSR